MYFTLPLSGPGMVCRVPWCGKTGTQLTFQHFPDNEIRQLQWLTLLGLSEEWENVPTSTISNYLICNLHFDTRLCTVTDVSQKSSKVCILKKTLKSKSFRSEHIRGNLVRPSVDTTASKSVPLPTTSLIPTAKATGPRSKKLVKKRALDGTQPAALHGRRYVRLASDYVNAGTVRVHSGGDFTEQRINESPRKAVHHQITSQSPATRESFSLEKKMEIVRMLESGMKQVDVCRESNLHKSTVWSIWKNKEKIEKAFMSNGPQRKKLRKSNFEEVDAALFKWYNGLASQNVTVTGRLLQTMAESFAQDLGKSNFVCTSGWLERFKQRYCITLGTKKSKKNTSGMSDNQSQIRTSNSSNNGENHYNDPDGDYVGNSNLDSPAGAETVFPVADDSAMLSPRSSDGGGALTDESPEIKIEPPDSYPPSPVGDVSDRSVQCIDWLQHSWPRYRTFADYRSYGEYSPQDIFTAEEIGLLYRITPMGCWKLSNNTNKKSEEPDPPFNIAEERITVVLCANAAGTEKRRLVVVSQQKSPPSVTSVVGENFARLPADYYYTSEPSSWITPNIFGHWLRSWNRELQVSRTAERKVLLLLHDTPLYEKFPANLNNIKLIRVPNRISDEILPLRYGNILHEFRLRYRRLQLERMIYNCEQRKHPSVSLFDAILILNTAWAEIDGEAIKRCFSQSLMIENATRTNTSTKNRELEFDTNILLDRALQAGLQIPVDWEFTNFVNIDDCLIAVDNPCVEPAASNGKNIEPNSVQPEHVERPPSPPAVTNTDIQMYLDVIKIWTMSRANPCPQEIHECLSKVESYLYNHNLS